MQMRAINDRTVIFYKTQKLLITLINSVDVYKNDCFKFYEIDMRKYDMILKIF